MLGAIARRKKYDNDRDELMMALWRVQVADFRNVHRGEDDPVTRPKDVVRLSFDSDEIEAPDGITQEQQAEADAWMERQKQKRLGNQHEHKTDG